MSLFSQTNQSGQARQQNPLLLDIKATLTAGLPDSTLLTDPLRRRILPSLIAYADKIPYAGADTTFGAGVDDSDASVDAGISAHALAASPSPNSPTLKRWQILAYVASVDLTLAKWFESHLDALSILHEVGNEIGDQVGDKNGYELAQKAQYQDSEGSKVAGLWAVWAAEGLPLTYQQGKVNGAKAWCSGAAIVDYGLLTYRDTQGSSQLLIVAMQQDGITIDSSGWQAVGMQGTATATVALHQVAAKPVGAANAYLDRAGFWHGAAGVAACWYGATAGLAAYLLNAYLQKPHAYKAMYLGQISSALAVSRQYLYYVAQQIDRQPHLSHELAIRQLRANIEQLARQVLETVGQALGAAPFCHNAHFARLAADLPVFIRQSHAAFDLQKIGELAAKVGAAPQKDDATPSTLLDEVTLWQL